MERGIYVNSEFVLKLIEPYLVKNQLRENDFENIFKMLNLHEKYSVIDLLIENDIDIIYELEEESSCADSLNEEKEFQIRKESNFLNINNNNLSGININNEQLCLLYQKGDNRALDILYIKNQKFIWKMALKIGKRYNHKLEMEDLVSYGFFGLQKAALKFDPEMDNKFITYAGHWINQSILRAIADYGFTIRVPVHMFENINFINKLAKEYEDISENEILELIACERDVDYLKVKEWFLVAKYIMNPSSLNLPVGEDKDTEVQEFLASHEPPIERKIETELLRKELTECIDVLKPKQAEIIKMRFGFDQEQMTLEEVGKKFNLTRERIRQIESKAITKLRSMGKIKELKIYLEE